MASHDVCIYSISYYCAKMIYLWSVLLSVSKLSFSHWHFGKRNTHTHSHTRSYTTLAYCRHIALMQHIRWNVRSGIAQRPRASIPLLGPSDLLLKCEMIIKLSPFNQLANSWVLAHDGSWDNLELLLLTDDLFIATPFYYITLRICCQTRNNYLALDVGVI